MSVSGILDPKSARVALPRIARLEGVIPIVVMERTTIE